MSTTYKPSVLPSLLTESPLSSIISPDSIRISSPATIDNFNTQENLLLEASIRSSVSCYSNWSTSDPTLILSTAAIVSGSELVLSDNKVSTVQLYLNTNALSPHHSYQFTVHCGSLQSMIVVTTNAPPSQGALIVSPRNGTETRTQFLLSASLWTDDHLPLSFEFGFFDPNTGTKLILQGKSAMDFSKSTLPAGLSGLNYLINSTVGVFDSLSASASRSMSVKCAPSNFSVLESYVNSHISSSMSSASIVLVGNIMNKVNCTGATNCRSYNRQSCATVDHTCGECLSGFIGSSGPQNSLCYKDISDINVSPNECTQDSDCNPFHMCDTTTSTCFVPSCECPNLCSSHGVCRYVDTNTGLAVADCKVTSSDCRAVCVCNKGFSGTSCTLTAAHIAQKQSKRAQLLQSLNKKLFRNISGDAIISQSSSLLSLTQKTDELGVAAVSEALIAANYLLDSALQAQVGYRDLVAVVKSMDNVASAVPNNSHTFQLMDTFATYGSITASQLIGEQNVVNIFSKFRMRTIGLSKGGSNLSVPQTPLESLQPTISSSVHFTQNETNSIKLKVTVIESSASLLGNSKQYISNPLIVQISNINGLTGTGRRHGIVVVLKRVASFPTLPTSKFTTICRAPKFMSGRIFNYTCPFLTGHILTHNCSNKVGKLVSYCPVYKPSCASLPVTQSSFESICHMVNYTDTLTWCQCFFLPVPYGRRNLGSASVAAGLQDSGALQVVTISELIPSNVVNKFSAASSLTDSSDIEKSLIVIIMFATLWSAGFALLAICNWRKSSKKKVNEKEENFLEDRKRDAEAAQSSVAVQEYLSNYIIEIFPAVFQKKSRFQRIVREIRNRHRYIALFCSEERGTRADQARVLKVFQVLSTQNLLMFLVALLYDIQSPSDDGSCTSLVTKNKCLERTSPLDSSQSYCSWSFTAVENVSSLDGYVCDYREPVITFQVVLVIAVIVSISTAIILGPVDYLFDLLNSPAAEDAKKIVDARASIEASVTGSATSTLVAKRIQKRFMVGVETRILPGSTETAQELARAAAPFIAPTANHLLHKQNFESIMLKHRLRNSSDFKGNNRGSNDDEDSIESNYDSIEDEDDDDDNSDGSNLSKCRSDQISQIRPHKVRSTRDTASDKVNYTIGVNALISQNKYLTLSTDQLIEELTEDISMQRKLLRPSELEDFDRQWGVDPTGELIRNEHFGLFTISDIGAKGKISLEIDTAQKVSLQMIEKLKLASDAHAGVEILHLFILDMLGRDTSAARIFKQKSEEDFKRTQVVSGFSRMIAVVLLLVMNIIFAYYSALYGFTKGLAWQRIFLAAYIAQLLVEILVQETFEVVWVHYIVPTLVIEEVQAVKTLLLDIVRNICSISPTTTTTTTTTASSRTLLNAADYLFVSFYVAKCFPSQMESFLVQTFTSYFPGELSRKWDVGSMKLLQTDSIGSLTIAFGWLKYCATAPPFLQSVFIRCAQPFFVSGFIMLSPLLEASPAYISVFVVGVAVVVAFVVYRYVREVKSSHHQGLPVGAFKNDGGKEIVEKIDDSNNNILAGGGGGGGSNCVYDHNISEPNVVHRSRGGQEANNAGGSMRSQHSNNTTNDHIHLHFQALQMNRISSRDNLSDEDSAYDSIEE